MMTANSPAVTPATALPFPVALAPSTCGMGPNTYLNNRHFNRMVIIALVAHVVVLGVYGILPDETIRDIPVRALSFKLGPRAQIAAYAPSIAAPVMTATPMPAPPEPKAAPKVEAPPPEPVAPKEWKAQEPEKPIAKPTPKPRAKPKPQTKIVKVEEPPLPRQRPEENVANYETEQADALPPLAIPLPPEEPDYAALAPSAQRVESAQGLPKFSEVSNLPDETMPRRYVRDYGMPSYAALTQPGNPEGSVSGEAEENVVTEAEEIKARYEQQISAWIAQHKIYPVDAGEARGRVVLRVRVDRQGFVRYYAVEEGSGNALLDRAGIEMVRRANPVPAVPENYPADNLIEFLIPINFEAPSKG